MKTLNVWRIQDYAEPSQDRRKTNTSFYPRFRVQPALDLGDSQMPLSGLACFVFKNNTEQALHVSEVYARAVKSDNVDMDLRRSSLMLVHTSMHYMALAMDKENNRNAYYLMTQNVQDIFASAEMKFGKDLVESAWHEAHNMMDLLRLEKEMSEAMPMFMAQQNTNTYRLSK